MYLYSVALSQIYAGYPRRSPLCFSDYLLSNPEVMTLRWTLPLAFDKALPDHIIIPVDSDPSEQRSKMNLSGYQEVCYVKSQKRTCWDQGGG